ncbi:hypothetical protein [Metallosphaera cuprina]|uniref:Uncharacterized protein n=1 Tax=Metallosphaera cuprina (strain Ar-4) TaxID=1006006 RepID=F4G1E5_METCR|nr:hypothetical protein [Metallosphaera cuprina]AEB94758.1 conserved hypothetical protein [Metallosphaera cuprina Ar-4]
MSEKISISKENDIVKFNGKPEALKIGRVHISEPINEEVYFFMDEKDLIISMKEEDLMDFLNSIDKQDAKLEQEGLQISQIGLVYKMRIDSLEVVNVADWSLQNMFTLVNEERARLSIGPSCEYNDCVYLLMFSYNNFIYFLKIRFIDGNFEAYAYKVNDKSFENELIFYTLKHTFRLF